MARKKTKSSAKASKTAAKGASRTKARKAASKKSSSGGKGKAKGPSSSKKASKKKAPSRTGKQAKKKVTHKKPAPKKTTKKKVTKSKATKSKATKKNTAPKKAAKKKVTKKKVTKKKSAAKKATKKKPAPKKAAKKKATKKPAKAKAAPKKAASKKVPGKGRKSATVADAVRAAKAVRDAEVKRPLRIVQQSSLKPGSRGTKAAAYGGRGAPKPSAVLDAKRRRRFSGMSPEQRDRFRDLLLERRTKLANDLNLMTTEALKATEQDSSSDHMADHGTDNYEQDFTLSLIENEEAILREINAALERIGDQTYGGCEACGAVIPLTRLEAIPFTRHCVDCQQAHERGR